MRTYLECIPCFFKQAIEASRLIGASARLQRKIIDDIARRIPTMSLSASPPEMGRVVYGAVERHTRRKDPYKEIKAKSNRLALRIYPTLKRKVSRSRNSLLTAVELAIAGNIIDYGVKNSLDVETELKRILSREEKIVKKEGRTVFNYPEFKRRLKKARTILYIGDNAGETVFDRVLIEEIQKCYGDKEIVYAVKERPIINDALKEDARRCGIDKIARILSTGLAIPGTVLSLCSKEFASIFKSSDMIISKGQGNFETLSEQKRDICFLFMVKCPVVSRHINCRLGDIVLRCS